MLAPSLSSTHKHFTDVLRSFSETTFLLVSCKGIMGWREFVQHPYFELLVHFMLLTAALNQTIYSWREWDSWSDFEAHHGLLFFAFFMVLKGFIDLSYKLDDIDEHHSDGD